MLSVFMELGRRCPTYEEKHPQIPTEKSERFERLCYRALAECAISESKASELLEISIHDINNRMDNPVGSRALVTAEL